MLLCFCAPENRLQQANPRLCTCMTTVEQHAEHYAMKCFHPNFVFHHSGVSITRSQFTVGRPSIAVCISDTPATLMEWLTNGRVVESAMSTQTLDLIIPLVNDSVHNDVFICRVTRQVGGIATQNFTVDVVGM